jgi:hypothetical protein
MPKPSWLGFQCLVCESGVYDGSTLSYTQLPSAPKSADLVIIYRSAYLYFEERREYEILVYCKEWLFFAVYK